MMSLLKVLCRLCRGTRLAPVSQSTDHGMMDKHDVHAVNCERIVPDSHDYRGSGHVSLSLSHGALQVGLMHALYLVRHQQKRLL